MTIEQVRTPEEIETARALFLEYAREIDDAICFQSYEEEVAGLPGDYSPPKGRLLLARDGDRAAGCIALRPLGSGACEMKRLFIRPAFRGTGLGRRLAIAAIEAARDLGYARMRLDTLPRMREAIALYGTLGFRPIDPYHAAIAPGALYFELPLDARVAEDSGR